MELLWQLVATHGNGFRLLFAVSALRRFAADCHRLQPRGSIETPSFVVLMGYGGVA
jgi:hypothetical protein